MGTAPSACSGSPVRAAHVLVGTQRSSTGCGARPGPPLLQPRVPGFGSGWAADELCLREGWKCSSFILSQAVE